MEAAAAPVGLLQGQDGLRETGAWCDKLGMWRRHLQLLDGRYVDIVEDYAASDTDGAWILWSGSLVLSRCVESYAITTAASTSEGRRACAPIVAVELGAGSGLVSVVAAAAGLHAIATEQESGLPYLRANAAANTGLFTQQHLGSFAVQKMHWGTAADADAVAATVARLGRKNRAGGLECAPTLLLGSDLTYLPAVMESLAETLAKLAGPDTVVWIAHDDASHPGCPRHRATFFGAPQDPAGTRDGRHRAASLQMPQTKADIEPEPAKSSGSGAVASEGIAEWQGTHTGGILERHGFGVARLAVEDMISEEWRVPTVHVFELRLSSAAK